MSIKLLTLSITEAKPNDPNNFEIICMRFSRSTSFKAELLSLEMTKKGIFDESDSPLWDIGKVTLVDSLGLLAREPQNPKYVAKGSIRLLEDKIVTHDILRRCLEANLTAYDSFRRDENITYAVVRPKRLLMITENQEKQYLKLEFDNNHRDETILNKDYRWIHYWRSIPDQQIDEKQMYYREFIDRSGKQLYLILKRYYFPKNKRYNFWISGMHLL